MRAIPRSGAVVPHRMQVMAAGVAALHDVMRVLRSHGAARRADGNATERGALFELGALHERMTGFVEDQSSDDWEQFWVTSGDVTTLRARMRELHAAPKGIASTTLPALDALLSALEDVAQRDE